MSLPLSIAQLNDMLRTTFLTGRVFITQGIEALPTRLRAEIIAKVQAFDEFTEDNDPYGERDFGSFAFEGAKCFWKIDAYADGSLTVGAEDPADPSTVRMLTVMLAEEY